MKKTLFALLLCCHVAPAFAQSADTAFAEQISDEALNEERGMGGLNPDILNASSLSGISYGNVINNSVTGYNNIGSQAFQNANGIINIIQNTGNSVVVQNSTLVSLTLK